MSEACEKQLATQHRLAPGHRKDIDTTTEGTISGISILCASAFDCSRGAHSKLFSTVSSSYIEKLGVGLGTKLMF